MDLITKDGSDKKSMIAKKGDGGKDRRKDKWSDIVTT